MGLLNDFSPGATLITLGADYTQSGIIFGVYVGTAGIVKVDTIETTGIAIVAQAGTTLPWAVRKVYSTANGTTAADLVAIKLP